LKPQIPWLRVFVEGVVIVGSILLAFGIEAWWDGRQEREEEQAILTALRSELADARQGFEDQLELLDEDMRLAATTLEALSNAQVGELPTDSVRELATTLGPSFAFQPPRAALNDLLNGGGIVLIQSDTLRRAIAAYEQILALDADDQELLVDLWLNHMAPYRYEHGVMPDPELAPQREGVAEAINDITDLLVEARRFDADEAAFVGSRAYSNLLWARVFRVGDVRSRHLAVIGRIDALLVLLSRD